MHRTRSEPVLCLQSHRKLFAKVCARFRPLEVTFLAIIILSGVFGLFITTHFCSASLSGR